MPEAKAAKIADEAELIVGGYAMTRHDLGIRIVNLHRIDDKCLKIVRLA